MDTIKHPYESESESMQLGELTIENREDCVALYGSLDLTRDQPGLANAKALHALLGAVVAKLESETLPAHVAVQAPKTVKNPFTG